MNFESQITIESKTCPGVKFTLNKMTRGRRVQLDLALAPVNKRFREIWARIERLRAEAGITEQMRAQAVAGQSPDIKIPPDVMSELIAVQAELDSIGVCEREPAVVKWGLASVDGLTITVDGKEQPATPELLIAAGPPELFQEILDAVDENCGLSAEQTKNSERPSTSTQAEGRETTSSTATNANETAGGAVTGAPGIFLVK